MAIIPERIRRSIAHGTLLLCATFSVPGLAEGQDQRQSLPELSSVVNQHLLDIYLSDDRYTDVQIHTNTPDARLRLAKCDLPLSISAPNNRMGGRVTTQVSCQSPDIQWSVYVISQVKLMANVVVARTPILRGQSITKADVELATADVTKLTRGFYAQVEDVIGMEPRRSLSPGNQIRAQWLAAPKAIKRGERVTIVASSAMVAVEATGTALSDGRLGEQIRVRNERSDRVVKGTVSGDKLVSINL